MPLLMVRNDITSMQVDAIVNPSNSELKAGRGTSSAIYHVAGYESLTEECAQIGGCEAGKAVLTKGFKLPAKFIIHAVCPAWTGSEDEKALLKQSYRSALQLAAEYGFQSVAFPLLSSGFYGWPKSDAFHTATTVISEFLLEHEMTVYLVLYDHESVEVSKKLFAKIEEYIDDHYVGEHDRIYRYAMKCEPESAPCSAPTPVNQALQPKKATAKFAFPFLAQKPPAAKARKLDELMSHMDETFSQMLLRLIDERGLKDSTVYHKANIDRRLFSKIRKDANYAPTKKTVLAFAIALELSLDETIDLLMKAGFAFSNSSKFDVIISFFIENRSYNVFEINEVLFAYGQPILGE